jgi:hypothetical protein
MGVPEMGCVSPSGDSTLTITSNLAGLAVWFRTAIRTSISTWLDIGAGGTTVMLAANGGRAGGIGGGPAARSALAESGMK